MTPRFFGIDDFFHHIQNHRIVNFTGAYGSGKSSLITLIAFEMLREGMVEAAVATMPLSFAVPFEYAPLANVVVLLDEFGVEFDSRSFANKKQNNVRRALLAFPRKLNMFLLVASRVSVDSSFRSLTCQRTMNLSPLGFPLEQYVYGLQDGELKTDGHFWVWGRNWLWDKRHPSPVYGNEYAPGEVEYVVSYFEKALCEARGSGDPNALPAGAIDILRRWFGLEHVSAPNNLLGREGATIQKTLPGESAPPLQVGGDVLGGAVSQEVNAGRTSFDI